jgi:hypothetical protein
MARKAGPIDEDYDHAARLGLLGLTPGQSDQCIVVRHKPPTGNGEVSPLRLVLRRFTTGGRCECIRCVHQRAEADISDVLPLIGVQGANHGHLLTDDS